MKLIIDIPKVDYECAKQRWMQGGIVLEKDYCISKGIPLDDVKAELEEMRIKFMNQGGVYEHSAYGLDYAIALLDNIGKAESEE